jgi:hypothetical protein
MDGDARSFRIALAADSYVNPPAGGVDGLAVLDQAGWGVMQLPDPAYPAEMTSRILADIAEQVQEFHRHRYDIVLIGDDDGIVGALAEAGVPLPDQVTPASAAELREFLSARPAPQAIRPPGRPGQRGLAHRATGGRG